MDQQRIKDLFRTVHGKVCQMLSPERMFETREEVREKLGAFLIDCKKYLHMHEVILGPPKKDEKIEGKSKREYGGDIRCITDIERGKGIVITPEEVVAFEEALGDEDSYLMRKYGIIVVDSYNCFDDPKDLTGYRALYKKLAFPVGDKEGDEQEYHVVEFQLVAEQLEEIYDVTHPFKDRAEELLGKENPTKEERREAAYNFAACRYYNGITARDNGYDKLLKPQLRGKHAITKPREERLEYMLLELKRMKEENELEL